MMKKYFFLLICVLFMFEACISESTKKDEAINEEQITEVKPDTVPQATVILWIDFDLRGNSAQGKIVQNVKAKVNILPDGTVKVLGVYESSFGSSRIVYPENIEKLSGEATVLRRRFNQARCTICLFEDA